MRAPKVKTLGIIRMRDLLFIAESKIEKASLIRRGRVRVQVSMAAFIIRVIQDIGLLWIFDWNDDDEWDKWNN